jgi:hypothetical protein
VRGIGLVQAALDFVNIAFVNCHGMPSKWKAWPTIANVAAPNREAPMTLQNAPPSFAPRRRCQRTSRRPLVSACKQTTTTFSEFECSRDVCRRHRAEGEYGADRRERDLSPVNAATIETHPETSNMNAVARGSHATSLTLAVTPTTMNTPSTP